MIRPPRREPYAAWPAVHTRRGVERILRFGFNLAMTRRRRLTMITKSNALRFGMTLWDDVLDQLRGEFPEVEADRQHADFAAMDFVRRPGRFDVVVASNLFGDILSDLGAAIIGGLGLAPSANINPERTAPSMFEPVHGSAPDIAWDNTGPQEVLWPPQEMLPDVFQCAFEMKNGCSNVPEAPGLGVKFNREAAKSHSADMTEPPHWHREDGSFTNY